MSRQRVRFLTFTVDHCDDHDMSRRNNNVRGPTSALTEFLRVRSYMLTQIWCSHNDIGVGHHADDYRTSCAHERGRAACCGSKHRRPSRRRRRERAASSRRGTFSTTLTAILIHTSLQEKEYASDNLDDTDTEKPPPAKKRKLTKAQEAKQKAAAKKAAAAKKKAKKGGNDDDYSDNEDEDAYTALSKMWKDETRPPNGGFCTCAKCGKQFTVVSLSFPLPSLPLSPSPLPTHPLTHPHLSGRQNTHNRQPHPPATSATPASNPPPPPTPSKSPLSPASARPPTREASRILKRGTYRVWRRCAWGL